MKLEYLKIITENGRFMNGGNQSHFGRSVRKSGCGMIAACDMLLYKQGKKSISDTEYKHFISEHSDFFYKHRINSAGVTAWRILKFLRRQGYLFSFVPRYKLKGERFEQLIKAALERDTPVIVRIGLNRNRLRYKVTHTVSGKISQGRLFWHYITITGLENDMLTYSSWGAVGEMQIFALQNNLGFMGGIICPSQISD